MAIIAVAVRSRPEDVAFLRASYLFSLSLPFGTRRCFVSPARLVICDNASHSRSAGELTPDEVEKMVAIIQNPKQFKIPQWFLNRQKDYKTGKYSQVFANNLEGKLREDLERLKKIRAHRGLRHYWGIRVRGQHTKTTGRRGKTVGIAGKK